MPDTPAAPPLILELVERFILNKDHYLSPNYNEEELRHEFLNPMFQELGWDMTNKEGASDAFKDVLYEEAIKAGSPDYTFRVGSQRQFFLEAKAPHVNIAADWQPALQLRSYARSAGLSLSILTNFAQFAVYDGRIKISSKIPKPSEGLVFPIIPYTDYPARWHEIASIFSRKSVRTGLFARFAESTTDKRRTFPIGDEFLEQISEWREQLACYLRRDNPSLDAPQLNFAVQMTIDRLIFLRIAEDRGIEPAAQLQTLAKTNDIYGSLLHVFTDADTRYNSGLFHFRRELGRSSVPDEITRDLVIEDDVLRSIIRDLYESHYKFDVIPTEILGQVYEQFLGKVIVLKDKTARVEEKPEVRKAGGVYYTPAYIVNYIVDNTLGELLQDKTPSQAAQLRILDPACGSGSFLLGAYQKLLDWHLDYYHRHDPEKLARQKNPPIRQVPNLSPIRSLTEPDASYRLTIAERKRILLNNIFGVDVDPQAVEVTKLSLLLKCLEGETAESVQSLLKFMRQRALPDLDDNIKRGNSLIAHDFYDPQQFPQNRELPEQEKNRVHAFDWPREFPKIMKNGGFDVIIGNPPYVRIQNLPQNQVAYLTATYRAAKGNSDLYVSFVEQAFVLLRQHGLVAFILPNKFFRTDYGQGLRLLLASEHAVRRIVDFGASQVFDATTYTCLLFLRKDSNPSFFYALAYASPASLTAASFAQRDSSTLGSYAWTFESADEASLLSKLAISTTRLLDLPAFMSRGSSSGNDQVFMLPADKIAVEPGILRVPLFATDFGRYRFALLNKWKIIFPYLRENGACRLYLENELRTTFPRAFAYLRRHQTDLKRRKQYAVWFGYSAPRNLELHDAAHILVPLLAQRGSFTLIPDDLKGRLCPMASGGFTITLDPSCRLSPQYVLGILNSTLLFWRLRSMSNIFRGGWISCTKQYFGELPIRHIRFTDPADKSRHDRMVQLVTRILDLHQKLPVTKLPTDKTRLQREIAATDAQIDALVYQLYALTPEEIQLVESATAPAATPATS
jgi:hypothetical protein